MYFRNFPKIFYNFDDTKIIRVVDILRNVRFREVLNEITLWDYYLWEDGDTFEIISEKIYGNPDYFFIIMLANDMFDYRKDVSLTNRALQKFILEKYPVDYYYRDLNLVWYNLGSDLDKAVEILRTQHNRLTTGPIDDAKIRLKAWCELNPGTPGTGLPLDNDTLGNPVYFSCVHTHLNIRHYEKDRIVVGNRVEDITSIPDAIAINNKEWEERENEKKRRIRLPHTNVVDRIINDFKNLI